MTDADRAGDRLDVVYVLCLLQAAFVMLAAVGELLLMGGNPAYVLVPGAKAVLLIIFGGGAVKRRRWALRALTVLSWITLGGFALQLVIGLFPAVVATVNIVGLLTNVAMPIALIVLCRPTLRAIREARRQAKAMRTYAPAVPWPATPQSAWALPGGPDAPGAAR